MQDISSLKLIAMRLLQTCSYVTQQMQTPVRFQLKQKMEGMFTHLSRLRERMIQLSSPLPQPQLPTQHPSPPSKSSLWIIIVNVDKLKPFIRSIFKKGKHQLFHAFSLLHQRSTKHVEMQYIQNRVDYIEKVIRFVYQMEMIPGRSCGLWCSG